MTDFRVSNTEGRSGVDRAREARRPVRRLACFAVALLGLALLSGQNPADAAAGKGAGDTALAAAPSQTSNGRESAKRSASEVVVLRGTLPAPPDAGQPPPVGSADAYAAPGDEGFQLGPLYGSGWDTRFDYSGLSGTYFPVPQ
jgi:hypothetical protein